VLFHVKQTHAPADCPLGKGGSRSLFDESAAGVTLRGFWLSFPEHTNYLVVEADDAMQLNAFLRPGSGRCVAEITPVVDQPLPTS
jgi:hypothetical protein